MDGDQLLVLCIRVGVASVLLMAALTKLPRLSQFVEDVRQYRLLRPRVATVYAVALPWLELAAAASLLTGMWLPVGGGIALLLLGSFMVAVAVAMARGVNLTCSCFGLLYRERVGWSTLSRDGVLTALVLGILLLDTGRFAVPTVVRSLPQPIDVVALATVLLTLTASLALALLATKRAPAPSVRHAHADHAALHQSHSHTPVDLPIVE